MYHGLLNQTDSIGATLCEMVYETPTGRLRSNEYKLVQNLFLFQIFIKIFFIKYLMAFLRKTGSFRHIPFAVVYSGLQKGLRGNLLSP